MIFRGRGCGCFSPFVLLLAGIAAVIVFHTQILTALGTLLVKNDPPQKSDAVVALAGDDFGYRVLTAGRLVKEGWAPYALISGTPDLLQSHTEIVASVERTGSIIRADLAESYRRRARSAKAVLKWICAPSDPGLSSP